MSTATVLASPSPPKTLAELTRMVIEDWGRLDRSLYAPWCMTFHVPVPPWREPNDFTAAAKAMMPKCHVCDAGAIMAGRLSVPIDVEATVYDNVPDAWEDALRAADALRVGDLTAASRALYGDHDQVLEPYPMLTGGFRGWGELDLHVEDLRGLAAHLEELGI